MKKLITVLTIFAVAFAFTGLVLANGAGDIELQELENKITVKPPSDITLDYCGLAKTNGTGGSYTDFQPGWQNVTYFDPGTCPGVPTYPFEITAFSFTLIDGWGSNPWPYPVDVVVYDMLQPGDPCQGPGAELCRFTVVCDQSFEWPNVGTATFPQVCCANGPFFIGLDFADPNPNPPGPVWDDQYTTPCCDNWFFMPPSWGDWCWAFGGDPPSSGYPLFWVDGVTDLPACGDCVYTPGDSDGDGNARGLTDVTAMIDFYRGAPPPDYVCYCSEQYPEFRPHADADGDCSPYGLTDVTKSIDAYRGPEPLSGCVDCPGQRRLLPDENRPSVIPSLKSKVRIGRTR